MKKTTKLVSFLLTLCLLTAAVYVPFTVSAESFSIDVYANDDLFTVLDNCTVGSEFPEMELPEAPEGKFLAGFSTDEAGENLLLENKVPAGVTELYAIFRDYVSEATDTYADTAFYVPYPLNENGHFYPTTARYGWSFLNAYTDEGYPRFKPNGSWGEAGVVIACDDDGFPIRLEPYSKYTVTITYNVSVTNVDQSAYFAIGYGLNIKNYHGNSNKYINRSDWFEINTQVGTLENQTKTYAFETSSLKDMMPVCGATIGVGPANEIDVISINVEKEQAETTTCDIHWNGGYEDFDLTKNPEKIAFEMGAQIEMPKKAYRYRCAFAGWYEDEALTVPAGEVYEGSKSYYADWVLFGDVTDDEKVDNVDLIRAKKYFAGQSVEISAGTDVTGDDDLSNADLIRLKKHLAGMSVVLGITRYIAIAFDDGPDEHVDGFLDEFKKVNGRATFMVIGAKCNNNTKQYLQRIIDEGSEIGNHSALHGSLTDYNNMADMQRQMTANNEKIAGLLDGYQMKVGRLPNFAANDMVYKAMREIGMPLMGNGVVTDELTAEATAASISEKLIANSRDGAIVCLHATLDRTLEAMKTALPEMRKNGYEFVTCSEMFKVKNYKGYPLGKNINRAEQQYKYMAFTYDDGPNDALPAMTDLFKEYGGKCSFFVIGSNLTDAGRITYLEYAYNNGMEICLHSMTHNNMSTWTDKDKILAEFDGVNDLLKEKIGYTSNILRMPGNAANDTVLSTLSEGGKYGPYSVVRFSNIATYDWGGSTSTAKEVADSILKLHSDGGIANCHATAKTVEAMKIALPKLYDMGYRFVTVTELFELFNYEEVPHPAAFVNGAAWQTK